MEEIPDFVFDALAEIIAATLGRDNMLYAAAVARDPLAYNAALEPVARADPDGAARFLTALQQGRRELAIFMAMIEATPAANDDKPKRIDGPPVPFGTQPFGNELKGWKA